MKSSNKPRADAILKNLQPDRQAEIYSRLTEKTSSWPDTSLAAVKAWLAADGLKTSARALSEFRSWYSAQQDLKDTSDLLETFEEFTRQTHPDWSAEKVRDMAIQFFMAHTVARKDVGKFVSVAQLDQNERFGRTKAQLDERKVKVSEGRLELLKTKAAQADAAKDVIQSKLSPEEQKRRLKEILK